jgi:hypothetical protein
MKIKITDVAKQLECSIEDIQRIQAEKLTEDYYTGKGKNTWFIPEAVEILRIALAIPEALPEKRKAQIIAPAYNSNYVWAVVDGVPGKVPVCIPRKYRDRFLPKPGIRAKGITVDVIKDDKGVSYRYAVGA